MEVQVFLLSVYFKFKFIYFIRWKIVLYFACSTTFNKCHPTAKRKLIELRIHKMISQHENKKKCIKYYIVFAFYFRINVESLEITTSCIFNLIRGILIFTNEMSLHIFLFLNQDKNNLGVSLYMYTNVSNSRTATEEEEKTFTTIS